MTISGLPYAELYFNKTAKVDHGVPRPPGPITDLIVISHGWHQNGVSAEQMYADMMTELTKLGLPAGRTFGVTGILWPSDEFSDDLSFETTANMQGGAASVHDTGIPKLRVQARRLAPLFDMQPDDLEILAAAAANGGAGDKDKLLTKLRAGLDTVNVDADTGGEHKELLDPKAKGSTVLNNLNGAGARAAAAHAAGGTQAAAMGVSATGGGAGLGIFSGPVAAVATLLNQAAYFQLKKRAGVIGTALGTILSGNLGGVQRVHLVGHSFGARLVTAAASIMSVKPYSLTLLQGAFSHNALGQDATITGAYRNVVDPGKITQRIVITHTWNDEAVGIAYAIASRASNDVAAGLLHVTDSFGGAKDLHGGMGANGAMRLKSGEGSEATFSGLGTVLLGNGVNSLKCDFIKSHTDIRTPGVARVLAAAIA